MSEQNKPNDLDQAIAKVKQAGYWVEMADVYRRRENHLQTELRSAREGVSTQNGRGEWVRAIPEPLFLAWGRVQCDCGEKFRGRSRYRGHYALVHILGMDR